MSKAKKTDDTPVVSIHETLTEAGFAVASSGVYTKGKKKAVISYSPSEGGPVEDWKFFNESSDQAVVHSQGVMPIDEFMTEFLS